MIGKVKFGKKTIQYQVIKSKRRKTSEIQVDKSGVIIRTPIRKTNSQIKKTIQEKKQWIYKKQLEFKNRSSKKRKSKLLSERFLKTRVAYYSNKLGAVPTKINIKKLKSRWGSSTQNNELNFNSNLLKAPKDVVNYVILHELCHLRIKGHNRNFWNLVAKFMPNYEEKIHWLEIHGKSIM